MLQNIKTELLKSPNKIKDILEHFGYCHIVIKENYMHFARDSNKESSPTSICIKLKKNNYLYVIDYPKNINCDFFSYIMTQRKCEFSEVLSVVKNVLGISDYYTFFNETSSVFGGFYDNIHKKNEITIKTYDKIFLNKYEFYSNIRFLRDKISLSAQKFFGVRFDVASQSILIPIYNQFGDLMGIKARKNKDVDEENHELKYFYELPCMMSQTLFGYSHNYSYLCDNYIYVFESEKSVMQCFSYGIRNAVAIGSSSISKKQIQMLLEANPKAIILMHDKGLEIEAIDRNIKMIQFYTKLINTQIGYWDSTIDSNIPNKSSPSDLGKDRLLDIINNQIKMIGDDLN